MMEVGERSFFPRRPYVSHAFRPVGVARVKVPLPLIVTFALLFMPRLAVSVVFTVRLLNDAVVGSVPTGEWHHVAASYDGTRLASGVKIYIDGEFRGAGEYLHSDAKIWGSETNIRLEKDGCAPVTYKFTRNEEWDALPCVGGILLVPLFWAKKYHAEHVYDFACKKP